MFPAYHVLSSEVSSPKLSSGKIFNLERLWWLVFPDSCRMLQFHTARKSKHQFKLDETISSSGLVMLFYGDSGGACRLKFLSWFHCRQLTVSLISLCQYDSIVVRWCLVVFWVTPYPAIHDLHIDLRENDSLPLYLPGTGKTMTANAIASQREWL